MTSVHQPSRLAARVLLLAGVLAPAAARGQSALAPCASCVAVSLSQAGAQAAAVPGVPLAGIDVVLGQDGPVASGALAQLAHAGARVWLAAPVSAVPGTAALAAVTGVFLIAPAAGTTGAADAVYAVRRAATEVRATQPNLRVGLVLTPSLSAEPAAREVAPYLDAVWLPPDLAADAPAIKRRFPGLAVWIPRPGADPLSAGAGLVGETAIVDGGDDPRSILGTLAAVRALMPPGLTPLPDVRVTCAGCRAEVWMHPETLDAIAVVHGATAGSLVTIRPDAIRVARADTGSGTVVPVPVSRAPAGAGVQVDDAGDPTVLRITGWRGTEEDVYRSQVSVSAARRLTVDEVIARHQAQRARQARLVENAISTGTTTLTFEVPGFAGPLEITAATTVFTRGALTEVAQHDIRVNGVDMRVGAAAPRLPIIEPERVSTPPLAITLTAAYQYRLADRERQAGHDCYVVAFSPRAGAGPSFKGRAWIEAATFALVRMEATQTGLRGAIVSSEQHDVFAPVSVGGTVAWLPARSSSFQIYQAAALRTPIHREVVTPMHDLNVADFDRRLAAAHESDAVMLRDTPRGYAYLVRPKSDRTSAGPAPRVLAPAAGRQVLTLVLGTLLDPNISVPLPFAGLSYVDFDFLGKGVQFSGFFGGSYGQAAWTVPGFIRPRWQLTGRAFGIAASYNDRAFRNGSEQYPENIAQRPFRADVTVVVPVSARAQIRAGYEFEYTAFSANSDTAATFLVPSDAVVHGLRLALDVQRGPWSALVWWNPARRQGWHPWGRPGLDYTPGTADFQRYGLTASRSWVIARGAVARLEGSWVDGHDLDRFSRYSFDSFENRLRGYPSASLRFDRGAIVRSVATWTPPGGVRLDGFVDLAAVHDPGFGEGVKTYPGLGAAVEVPLPRRMLLAVEYGYGIKARNTDGSQGTHVVKITGFKIF